MKFLAITFLISIIFMMALQYRIELVFKHRGNAIDMMYSLSRGASKQATATMFRYYNQYRLLHQLLALNKWKYDAFFPELENKLLRIKLKHQ